MDKCFFIAARQILWDKNAWLQPARLGFLIRALEQIVADEETSPEYRVEAEMLIKKLYMAGKKPAGAI